MSTVILGETPVHTNGELPKINTKAPEFSLVRNDLTAATLNDFKGGKLVLNIFPSIDTSTCATSVRKFNEQAASLENTTVICIARDLPFAMKRFCGVEGIENAICLSDFRDGSFGKDYGLEMVDGPFAGLHSRAVIVIDENGTIKYTQQVENISNEPDYEAALAAL